MENRVAIFGHFLTKLSVKRGIKYHPWETGSRSFPFMLNCRSIANQISSLARGVFAGENSRYHHLHQTTRVAAAIAAHETANRISSRVKTWNRFFIFVQGLAPAAYQDSTHRKSNPRHHSQTVIGSAQ